MQKMKRYALFSILALLVSCVGPQDGTYSFELLTTNDVHGCFFDSTYVGDQVIPSLFSVKRVVDSVRTAAGKNQVLLVDAGDILQGNSAAYYYDYVDTLTPHLYSRMAAYMGYDAVTVGNHDVEAGHPVYDRVGRELAATGIPFLGGNARRTADGKPYFPLYKLVKSAGIRILILGYTNPNVKNWLSERLWSGMSFESLLPLVQNDVNRLRKRIKPQIVVVSVHSGTGTGDESSLENQGLDLFKRLRGVDFVIGGHDHRPVVHRSDSICLVNAGSHCKYVGHGKVGLTVRRGKVVKRTLDADLIPVDPHRIDTAMATAFRADYQSVKRFSTTPVGELKAGLRTREAYAGMCDYLNLIHTLGLSCTPAQLSIAAPLTFDGTVMPGTLIYNDLFTIYPFENQLLVVKMTGKEIVRYLEVSYEDWIRTLPNPENQLLKLELATDLQTGRKNWTFVNRFYNFDSVGGLVYTVDVTKPFCERVSVTSLAGGEAFEPDKTYCVAMTSYRANGGGGLLKRAGIDPEDIGERIVEYGPEIRNLLYAYLQEHGSIDPAGIGKPDRIGHWSFVPEAIAAPVLRKDMERLFGKP